MALRGHDSRRIRGLAILSLAVLGVVTAHGQEGTSYLAQAAVLLTQGNASGAMEVLREARERYRGTPLYPEILLQSARAALGMGDAYRARYFFSEVIRLAPDGPAAEDGGRALGDLLYADQMWAEAYEAYTIALRAKGWGDESWLRLRMAQIALEHLDDPSRARSDLARVDPGRLTPEELDQHTHIRGRAAWDHWPSTRLGLEDPNISALALDGDDLWVGTWSGGLARYARSAAETAVFRQEENGLVANTVRTIHVTARYVWVGTDQGLSQYSKALSVWREVAVFGGQDPKKVQAVREVGGSVYVATLGDGLWRLDGDRWARVGQGVLPTSYLTTLGEITGALVVGTMDAGLLLLEDAHTEAPRVRTVPGLTPRNITSVMEQGPRLWVTTYGDGLWVWDRATGMLARHGVSTGELGDDWVMCSALSQGTAYFGTFGGGVSFLEPDGVWGRLGLADGMGSLDVLAILADGPVVYFGTLGAGLAVLHRSVDPSE